MRLTAVWQRHKEDGHSCASRVDKIYILTL